MRTSMMIAGAALTFAGSLTAPAADAQDQRWAPGYTQQDQSRDGYDRDRRYNRGRDRQQVRCWRDGQGRRCCYRRADGMRRCEDVNQRRNHRARRDHQAGGGLWTTLPAHG